MADLDEAIGNLQTGDRVELIIVASTFMDGDFECVMAWEKEVKKLLQPVTEKQNSWRSGTFTLITDLADCAPENSLLVLLGLARLFASTGENNFNPRRCYILWYLASLGRS